jgi:long-subunit fatty acid transport protein
MHNIHFGAEYKVNDAWKIRGGFYTLYDLRDNNTNNIYTDEVGSYDMYFLTIGSSYKYKNTSFNVALMNSNLFTSSRVNHTKISGSVCFDF